MSLPLAIYKVCDHSMEPTLCEGDFVVVNRLAYLFSRPRVGDIVVARIRDSERVIVKRVATTVGDSRYALRGDNEPDSLDSRSFGPVPVRAILGNAWKVVRRG